MLLYSRVIVTELDNYQNIQELLLVISGSVKISAPDPKKTPNISHPRQILTTYFIAYYVTLMLIIAVHIVAFPQCHSIHGTVLYIARSLTTCYYTSLHFTDSDLIFVTTCFHREYFAKTSCFLRDSRKFWLSLSVIAFE